MITVLQRLKWLAFSGCQALQYPGAGFDSRPAQSNKRRKKKMSDFVFIRDGNDTPKNIIQLEIAYQLKRIADELAEAKE